MVVGFPRLWSSWTTPVCTCARSPWGLIAVSTHRTEACQTSPLQDPTPACLQSQVPAHLCVFPSGASGPLPKEQAGPKGNWPPLHPALDGLCSGQAYETPRYPQGGPGTCRRQALRQVPPSGTREGSMRTRESQQRVKTSLGGLGRLPQGDDAKAGLEEPAGVDQVSKGEAGVSRGGACVSKDSLKCEGARRQRTIGERAGCCFLSLCTHTELLL